MFYLYILCVILTKVELHLIEPSSKYWLSNILLNYIHFAYMKSNVFPEEFCVVLWLCNSLLIIKYFKFILKDTDEINE